MLLDLKAIFTLAVSNQHKFESAENNKRLKEIFQPFIHMLFSKLTQTS